MLQASSSGRLSAASCLAACASALRHSRLGGLQPLPLAGCLATFSRSSCRPAFYRGPIPPTGRPPCPRLVPTEPSYQGSTLDSTNVSFYQHAGARLLPTAEAGGFRRDDFVEVSRPGEEVLAGPGVRAAGEGPVVQRDVRLGPSGPGRADGGLPGAALPGLRRGGLRVA